jgi:phosphoglycerate kinase
MKPVAGALEALLGAKVRAAPDCVGEETERMAKGLGAGEVLLLENLRFHPGEEADDPEFSRKLASLGDVFVNDAFGAAHRAHASTDGIARLVRPAVAGLLMEKEIGALGRLLAGPDRPFVAILGGAKISDKIDVLKNLLSVVDRMLVGGGMANTFLRAQGVDVGSSLCEGGSLGVAREILAAASARKVDLELPLDFVAASRIEAGGSTVVLDRGSAMPPGFAIADVGGKSIARFCEVISAARTVFWNGPVGVFEIDDFSRGTIAVARAVAEATRGGTVSVIGGGDTARAVAKAGVEDQITHISTGGGASLEFVGGAELPGIAVLSKKERGR